MQSEVVAYFSAMLAGAGVTWFAAGVVGLAIRVNKLLVASVMGPVTGLLLYSVGFLPTPVGGPGAWLFSAFSGFMCTLTAKIFADFGPQSLTGLLKRGDSEQPPL